MPKPKKVLIIGGSLAGTTLALCLQREGYEVSVFEKTPQWSQADTPISVFPNAFLVLLHLKLEAAVRAASYPMDRIHIKRPNGKILMNTDLRQYYPRPAFVRKSDLHAIIRARLTNCNFYPEHELVNIQQDDQKIVARFANGNEYEGDLLVGADGVFSQVRSHILGIPTKDALHYSGYTCWRGFGRVDKPLQSTETWGINRRSVVLPSGGGFVGWWLTAEEEAGNDDEPEGTRQKLQRLFKGWHAPIPQLIESTEVILKKDIYDRTDTQGWWKGRAVLMGDAAHPSTPSLGHSGCTAIEDAAVLTRCLVKYGDDHERAFEQFEQSRYPRTSAISHDARILATMGHWSNPIAIAMRNLVMHKNQASPQFYNIQKYFDYDALSIEI